MNHAHFGGDSALEHVTKKRAGGVLAEPHGSEMPGPLFAATDSARLITLLLTLFLLLAEYLHLQPHQALLCGALLSIAMTIGWMGRCAWLAWVRLERLHRMLQQERYEIAHHRGQEREELRVLYSTKGFEGPLLEQVLDVLMADDNRLLLVMLEEEMGLDLESYEHPLKQSLGVLWGSLVAIAVITVTHLFLPGISYIIAALVIFGCSAAIAARSENNRLIPAIVWNVGIGALTFGVLYFSLQLLTPP